jgi:hypothetical protein
MARVVVRKGYRSLPGRRRELLAALQRKDALAAEAGWPRGRYLAVETRAPGEPDLEVEFAFESYAELERLERGLRERLARAPREVVSGEQEFLLEPSATRYLLLLEDGVAGQAAGATRRAAVSPSVAASGSAPDEPVPPGTGPVGTPEPPLGTGGRGQAEVQDRRITPRPPSGPPAVPVRDNRDNTVPARTATDARRPAGTAGAPPGPARIAESGRPPVGPARGPATSPGPSPARSPAAGADRGAARGAPPEPPDEAFADDDPFSDEEFEPVEEHSTPPPPEYPGLTPAEAQAKQLANARAALAAAERSVQLTPERRPDPPAPRPAASRPGAPRAGRDERGAAGA